MPTEKQPISHTTVHASRTKQYPYLPHQKVAESFHTTRPYQNIEGRGTSEARHHVPLDILFGDPIALNRERGG